MILSILQYPNEILSTKCERIQDNENISKLIKDMKETLKYYNGLGLSAPQIGISKYIFITHDGKVFINPAIISRKGKITSYNEGCLSCGTFRRNIRRSRFVTVSYRTEDDRLALYKPKSKLDNIIVQHEIDHLNGIIIYDK